MDSSIPGSDIAEMLGVDKIKKEPGDLSILSPGGATAKVPTSRMVTLIASTSKSGSTPTSGQKTILLVQAMNSKTGGMQSKLPSSASSILSTSKVSEVNVKKTTAVLLSSLLPPSMRGSTSKLSECVLTPARSGGARASVTLSSNHASLSSAKVLPAGGSPLTKMSNIDFQTPYGLVFNSRTIQADGNVCALKEYLCNFCQFKVSNADEMEQHFSTHLFTCRFCSFRCISRLDALCHKRDSHPAAADELAGYEDLDRPTLMAKINQLSRAPSVLLGNSSMSVAMSLSSGRTVVRSTTAAGPSLTPVSHASLSAGSNLSIKAGKMSANNSTSSVIMGSTGKPGDSYFAYRIVHDSDGKVQAYECDVCSYQSIRINDIFAHASTHSLAELGNSVSSGANENLWECFYCSFAASQQVAVVGHVIAAHPNKPIQLKRMPSSLSDQSSSGQKSAVFIHPVKQDAPVPKNNGLASSAVTWSERHGVPSDQADKKNKSEAGDQCIWGCYYCAMTSPSRNDIICHLKKDHSTEKLIVTRRRLARMASTASASATESSKPDRRTPPLADVTEKTPDVASGKSDGKAKKRLHVTEADGTDVQIGDIDSTEAHQGSAKSRRKQVAPRKVAEESEGKVAAAETSFQLALGSGISAVSEINGTLGPADVVQDVKKNVSFGGRKQGRSVSKYDGLIKKLKMAETEQSLEPFASSLFQDKVCRTHVESPMIELLKNGSSPLLGSNKSTGPEFQKKASGKSPCLGVEAQKSKSSPARSSPAAGGTRALSLLTGQLVSGYVKPPSKMFETNSSDFVEMASLNMEKSLEANTEPEKSVKKTGLKVGIVKVVGIPNRAKESGFLQKFVYDSEVSSARCGVCGATVRGLNALLQIQDHVAEHFDACKWKCAYCPFQSNERVRIVRHVHQRHPEQPLRLERRSKLSSKSLANKAAAGIDTAVQTLKLENCKPKLRGPRTSREEKFAQVSDTVWQCPFCSRRSLFQGFMRVHVQLAHPEVDIRVPLQRWPRCHSSEAELKKETFAGHVSLVRVEDSEHFPEFEKLIEMNGSDLVRELDIDDEFDSGEVEQPPSVDDADLLEFRCLHCHFRGANPGIVKCHILQSHHDDEVTVLDMRTSRRVNHPHVFMCKSVECQFMSTVQETFESHMQDRPSHANNKIASLLSPESTKVVMMNPSPETRSRTRVSAKPSAPGLALPSKRSANHQFNIARAVNGPDAVREMASQHRRTADGDIEYNDDGTIRAAELVDDGFGSSCMQCHHCEYRCTALNDMRTHLRKSHARSEPLSIDVNAAIAGLHSWLFFCPVNSCDYVASYYNVYKHHMDVEHPDSDVGFPAKCRPNKRRSLLSGSNRRVSSGGHDATYAASVRNSNRRSLVLDTLSESANESSRSDNGAAMDSSSSRSQAIDTLIGATGFHYKPSNNRPYHSTKDKSSFDFSRRYECVLCTSAVATLADMKAHLLATHDSSVTHQCIDRRARQLRKRQKILFCPQSTCSFCCKFEEELDPHVQLEHPGSVTSVVGLLPSEDNSSYQCSFCTFITTEIDNVKQHVLAEHEEATDGAGFTKIKTAFSTGGDAVMKVNDVDDDATVSSNESSDHGQTDD